MKRLKPSIGAVLRIPATEATEDFEAAVSRAIREAVPNCEPTVIGAAYLGLRRDGWYWSTRTPGDLCILFARSWQKKPTPPLSVAVEFERGEYLP